MIIRNCYVLLEEAKKEFEKQKRFEDELYFNAEISKLLFWKEPVIAKLDLTTYTSEDHDLPLTKQKDFIEILLRYLPLMNVYEKPKKSIKNRRNIFLPPSLIAEHCINCENEFYPIDNEYVCTNCGFVTNHHILISDRFDPSLKNSHSNWIVIKPYEKYTHIRNKLRNLEGTQKRRIKKETWEKLDSEKSYFETNQIPITYENIKVWLRTLKLTKLYRDIHLIAKNVLKTPLMKQWLPKELIEETKKDIETLNVIFDEYKHVWKRKNWITSFLLFVLFKQKYEEKYKIIIDVSQFSLPKSIQTRETNKEIARFLFEKAEMKWDETKIQF